MSAVVEIIEDVGDFVGDAVDSVGDVVSDVVSTVGDVVESVGSVVGDTIEKALDDPIATIAKVAAVATGNAWALPIIDGANVVAKGGDLGDALLAAGTTYVAQGVGNWVASDLAVANSFDVTPFTSQTASLATEFAGSIPIDAFSQAVGRGVGAATGTLLSGGDLGEAFTSGLISGAGDYAFGSSSKATATDFAGSMESAFKPATDLFSKTSDFLSKASGALDDNPFSDIFESKPLNFSSAPENVSGLASALGVDTTGLDMGDVIPTDNMLATQTEAVFKPIVTSREVDLNDVSENVSSSVTLPTNEDYFSGLSEDNAFKPDMSTQTIDVFAPLGDLTYGADAREAANKQYTDDINNVNNIRWDRGDFGNPQDPTNYSNEGRAYTGVNALNPTISSPTNAKAPSSLGKDLLKEGAKLALGAAAAGAATDLVKTVTGRTKGKGILPVPTIGPATYKNAPIQGFRMQKMQNAGGLTSFIPFVNDKNLLPIPDGFKPI
jgi:hypothetical protein